jgi:NADPH:quinone reductase-like Zn-dependent oxidoreductase
MKAVVYYDYGSPDVLKCEEIEKPTVGDHKVLIKVRAASVNPLDWRLTRGKPFFVRLMIGGLLKPIATRPGVDFAGQV